MKKNNDKRSLSTKISDALIAKGMSMKINAAKKEGQQMVNNAKKKISDVKKNITKK